VKVNNLNQLVIDSDIRTSDSVSHDLKHKLRRFIRKWRSHC